MMQLRGIFAICLLLSSGAAWADPIARHRMANGATLILQPRPGCGTFAIRLLARGGGAGDPQDQAGLTPVLARMLLEGTGTRSASQQALEIEGAGATIGTAPGYITVGLAASGPAPAFTTALDVIADAALHPALDPEALPRVIARERSALADSLENPDTARRRALLSALLPGHPLGRVPDPKEYPAPIDIDAVRRAHRERFVGSRLVLVLVGDFDPAAARERAIELLGGLDPGSAVSVRLPSPAPLSAPLRRRVRARTTQPQIVVAVPTEGLAEGEEPVLDLLAQILAGYEERIWTRLRTERGWAYWVDAERLSLPGAGFFGVATAVPRKHMEETRRLILEALDTIAGEPPSVEETRRAGRYLVTSLARSWQMSAWRAAQLASREARDLPPLTFDEQRDRIEAVTPAEITALAHRLLGWSPSAVVILR